MFLKSRTALFLIALCLYQPAAFSQAPTVAEPAPPPLPPLGDPLMSGIGAGPEPVITPLPPTPVEIAAPVAPEGIEQPAPPSDAPVLPGDVASPLAPADMPPAVPGEITAQVEPQPANTDDIPLLLPHDNPAETAAPAKPQDAGSVIDSFFSDSKIISPPPAQSETPKQEEETQAALPPLPVEDEPKKKVVRRAPPKPAYNYKSQILPPSIYKKEYSTLNRHLPKAVAKEDLLAKMTIVIARGDLNAVKALRDFGVPIQGVLPSGDTALTLATRYQQPRVMQWLLSQGVAANDTDVNGYSPLHYAAYAGSSEMVDMLLSYGANPNITDTRGLTPLSYADIRGAEGIKSVIRSFGGV